MRDKPKTAVVTSTIKDSYGAGRQIGEKIVKKIGKSPDLILFFCTLDYKENGGFEKLLKGIYNTLPDETQLAGGIVPGFLNKDGCYARGATALAISYPNMNICIGIGKNTKRNPKKAARTAVAQIKAGLKNKYENKIIFSIISGPKNPDLPGVKNTNIINSKIKAGFMLYMFSFMQKVFQKGFGKEREVLEEITKKLTDFHLIHTSNYSKPPFTENYQFHNKNVLDEKAVVVAIETDMNFKLNFATGVEKTNKNLEITNLTNDRKVIKKINKKPPLEEYIKKIGMSKEEFEEQKWTDITAKYPLGFIENNKTILRSPLLILGNYMGFLTKIEYNNVFIADVNPKKMISATNEVLNAEKPFFGFFTSCIARRDLLGIKVFEVQEKMKQYFEDKDFLLIYSGSEGVYKPNEKLYYLNETITSVIFQES